MFTLAMAEPAMHAPETSAVRMPVNLALAATPPERPAPPKEFLEMMRELDRIMRLK
jgi:hypothetical protein